MGTVWSAEGPDGTVAIKLLHLTMTHKPAVVERFLREARAGMRVNHPGVVRTLQTGIEDLGVRKVPWFSMEQVDGRMLKELLLEGRLPETTSRALALALAEALEAIHAAGIVHRDVKPSNVMVTPSGAPRLLDLGIARAFDDSVRLTATGQFIGSVPYAAPEQFTSDCADEERTDVYSLGLVMFELFSGHRAFKGSDLLAIYAEKLSQGARSPSEARPETDRILDQIVRHCTAREISARPTASQLVRWLKGEESPGDLPIRTTLGWWPDHNLPVEVDAFVDRPELSARLDALLDSGARLITLHGPAGAGKTRLSCRYTSSRLSRFPGGVWFCDLSDAHTEAGITKVIAGVLGIVATGEVAVRIGEVIAGRGRCLLIVDNVEQVVDAARTLVEAWMAAAPDAVFLSTSRETLAVRGEQRLALDALTADEALNLFQIRAAQHRSDFRVTGSEATACKALVDALDRLPLAIELAAARIKVLSPSQIEARLRDRFRLLVGGHGDGRQSTLRAAIDGSWELLSEAERSTLAQLSVFEGPFNAEAGEAVVQIDDGWVLDALQGLLDKSLLRRDDSPMPFRLLLSIRAYASERMQEGVAGPTAPIRERHAVHYARQTGTIFNLPVSFMEHESLVLDNVLAAMRWSQENGRVDLAAVLATRACETLGRTGPQTLACELGQATRAMPGFADLDSPTRISLLCALAAALLHRGRLAEALEIADHALTLAPNPEQHVTLLIQKGSVQRIQGKAAETRVILEEAITLARDCGAVSQEAQALANLALVDWMAGDLVQTRKQLSQALEIDRRHGFARHEAYVLLTFGLMQDEPLDQREHWLGAAMRRASEQHDSRVLGAANANLAYLWAQRGEIQRALLGFQRAYDLALRFGNLRGRVVARVNQARLCNTTGSLDRVETWLIEGETLAPSTHDPRLKWCLACERGYLAMTRGELSVAATALVPLEADLDRLSADIRPDILCVLAEFYGRSRDLDKARTLIAKAEAAVEASDNFVAEQRLIRAAQHVPPLG